MQLGYVILYVPQVQEAIDFYSKAFDMECRFHQSESGMEYAEMQTGSTVLAFASEKLAESHGFAFRRQKADDPAPAIEIGLVTDDVSSAFDKAVACGAIALSAPEEKPWGQTVSYVRDNHGFLIEICSPIKS